MYSLIDRVKKQPYDSFTWSERQWWQAYFFLPRNDFGLPPGLQIGVAYDYEVSFRVPQRSQPGLCYRYSQWNIWRNVKWEPKAVEWKNTALMPGAHERRFPSVSAVDWCCYGKFTVELFNESAWFKKYHSAIRGCTVFIGAIQRGSIRRTESDAWNSAEICALFFKQWSAEMAVWY